MVQKHLLYSTKTNILKNKSLIHISSATFLLSNLKRYKNHIDMLLTKNNNNYFNNYTAGTLTYTILEEAYYKNHNPILFYTVKRTICKYDSTQINYVNSKKV